jgi:hypothetical protein
MCIKIIYNNLTQKRNPRMFETPTILILHDYKGIPISLVGCQATVVVEGRRLDAVAHLALARHQNRRKRHFGIKYHTLFIGRIQNGM